MNKKINLLDRPTFGMLTVIREAVGDERKSSCAWWLCRCECANEVYLPSYSLASGNTRSCGCVSGKMRAVGRARYALAQEPVRLSIPISIDIDARVIKGPSAAVHLRKQELIFLRIVSAVRRNVVPVESLARHILAGEPYPEDPKALVSRLASLVRYKLRCAGFDPRALQTVPGRGYRLNV